MNVLTCVETVAQQFDQADLYYGHGTDNPWDEAVYLVFTVLGIAFASADQAAELDDAVEQRQLTDSDIDDIMELADRRIRERLPMAYLLRQAWFAGLSFYVDERVLVPRSPIAELILQQFQPLLPQAPARILDLCTGSGCIGIASALAFPQAQVELADISADALEVAERNIRQHRLGDRVTLIQSDLFAAIEGPYDLIVSNPPYVSAAEVAELPPEYQQEPVLGLLSDDDGLAIPLRILQQAPQYLTEQGVLVLELGYSWQLLAERYPDLPGVWLEFESGGEGVLAVSRRELIRAAW